MVSAKSLWGIMLFGGKLQVDAKYSNFDIFGVPSLEVLG